MEFPQIPTDNLYKFMALSGLALVIAFVLIPGQKLLELEKQRTQLRGEYEILKIESKERDEDFSSVRDQIDALKNKIKMATKKAPVKESGRSEVISDLHALENAYQQARQKDVQIQILLAKTNAKNDEMQVVRNYVRTTNGVLAAGASVGSLLIMLGFLWWYRRVQLLQDQLLKLQVDSQPPNPPLNSDPAANG